MCLLLFSESSFHSLFRFCRCWQSRKLRQSFEVSIPMMGRCPECHGFFGVISSFSSTLEWSDLSFCRFCRFCRFGRCPDTICLVLTSLDTLYWFCRLIPCVGLVYFNYTFLLDCEMIYTFSSLKEGFMTLSCACDVSFELATVIALSKVRFAPCRTVSLWFSLICAKDHSNANRLVSIWELTILSENLKLCAELLYGFIGWLNFLMKFVSGEY